MNGDDEMKTVNIRFTTIKDVQDFVRIVTKHEGDVDLVSGRYTINAKSIMGIFSLDLMSPIQLNAYSENTDELFEELKPYIM